MNLIQGRWWQSANGQIWSAPGLELRLPAGWVARGEAADGSPVTLGVRPEQFRLQACQASPEGQAVSDRAVWDRAAQVFARGRVVRVELLGPLQLARVAVGSAAGPPTPVASPWASGDEQQMELAVLVPAGQPVQVGQDVVLGLDANQANLFDGRTGENLKAKRPREAIPQVRADSVANPKKEN
jgi:ABC-type sugar transport system ATPase subunit